MTHPVARLGMNVLLCSMAISAIAAQSEQTPAPPSAVPPPPTATHVPFTILQQGTGVFRAADPGTSADKPASGEQGAAMQGQLRFVTGEEANEHARQMAKRLADPEQRAVLRAEQRAMVVSQNTGVGRSIGLDPDLEQKLIELLTDQQMERLDQMHAQPRPNFADLQKHADETTQRMNALRELLGDEKLDRFQAFEMSQSGRYWVGQLSARLAPADKLQPDQEDRLIALKQEQFQSFSAGLGSWRAFRRAGGQPFSIEDMQRESQRQARVSNEKSWRDRQVQNRAIEQKAAAFLTSTQLAELSKYHAQEQEQLRRFVEAARAEEGLDPKIPEKPEVAEDEPKLIEAQLLVQVHLTVNKEPTTVTRTVRNGESFTFEAPQGLIVEATPTMYDEWIDVHLKYYEEGATGRRPLSGSSVSTQARQPDGSMGTSGGGGTVITGRRGYAVETTINAKVL